MYKVLEIRCANDGIRENMQVLKNHQSKKKLSKYAIFRSGYFTSTTKQRLEKLKDEKIT